MNRYPYLRAYMAGIVVPTPLLLLALAGFVVCRCIYYVPIPIERVIVFPMALVPNLWGLWNMLYLALRRRPYLALGIHGALLPFVAMPLGFAGARALDFAIPAFVATAVPIAFPVVVLFYYLLWKHLVGFLNGLLGVA